MVNETAVFDLYDVFVNEVVGDFTLFLIISLAIIIIAGVRFRFPSQLVTAFMLFYGIILLIVNPGSIDIKVILILIIAIVGYFPLAKYLDRG